MSEEKTFEQRPEVITSLAEGELEKQCIKVNIPSDMVSYNGGNGEGCWALALTPEDAEIIATDNHKAKAKVVLCNSSIYCPVLEWSTVIQVEMRHGLRPILDIDWMQEQAKKDGIDYIAMLEEDEEE